MRDWRPRHRIALKPRFQSRHLRPQERDRRGGEDGAGALRLAGMRERAAVVNGALDIRSAPGKGRRSNCACRARLRTATVRRRRGGRELPGCLWLPEAEPEPPSLGQSNKPFTSNGASKNLDRGDAAARVSAMLSGHPDVVRKDALPALPPIDSRGRRR